jgi:hypothetical protein
VPEYNITVIRKCDNRVYVDASSPKTIQRKIKHHAPIAGSAQMNWNRMGLDGSMGQHTEVTYRREPLLRIFESRALSKADADRLASIDFMRSASRTSQ